MKRIQIAIEENRELYNKSSKTYEAVTFVEGEAQLYEQVSSNWKELSPLIDEAIVLAMATQEADKTNFSNLYRGGMKKSRDGFFKALETLVQFQTAQSETWTKAAEQEATSAKSTTLITLLIGTIIAIGIGLTFSRSLTSKLRSLAASLAEGASDVEKAARQIATASEELSQATVEQAASLEETSASIEEISSMINQNTEGAKSSAQISEQSLASAEKGKIVVEQMIQAIGDINDSNGSIVEQINASNKEIEDIVTVIAEIGNKTKVINDIVFQTKLLSFNASVEAARAGENGKGFAVVAEEVGKLAQMSGNSAKEISDMLESSISKVDSIVKSSKEKIERLVYDGKNKVETGTRIANECGNVLNEIVLSIASVSKKAADISVASQEQAQGVHEITKAMAQLDQVTQQNTSTSAESANASGSLSLQAASLNQIVQDLVHTIEGGQEGTARVDSQPERRTAPMSRVLKDA